MRSSLHFTSSSSSSSSSLPLGVPSPLCILELSRQIHIDMAVKTQLYLCNIQGVNVCTNISANYTFRPLPVRPYYISIPPVCTHAPNFVNEILSPLTLMIILHYCICYSSSDLYVEPEDGLTGRSRNI